MQIFKNILKKITEQKSHKVGFAGEMILDRFVMGYPERISREAPVVILRFERETLVPGGGGNTLNNMLSLGMEVKALTIVGNDIAGKNLVNFFENEGLKRESFIVTKGRTTTEKTRFVAVGDSFRPQQLLRLDRITEKRFLDGEKEVFIEFLKKLLSDEDVIVISDYGQFIFDEVVIDIINSYNQKKILIDSRESIGKFTGHFFLTPNEAEARKYAEGEGVSLARNLRRVTGARNVVVTMGERGMAYSGEQGDVFVERFGEGPAVEVSGAGDTVLAALSLGTVMGLDPLEAVYFASVAAEVVVNKIGTATVTLSEITEKIKSVV